MRDERSIWPDGECTTWIQQLELGQLDQLVRQAFRPVRRLLDQPVRSRPEESW